LSKLTPMMQQYIKLKEKHRDCLMFFRLGDFYELFFEDAEIASRELEITLTARGKTEKAPMCGVPHHAASTYIDRLISKGYKVAICEQIGDPSEAKGIVERDIVRIVTPGTLIDTNLLDDKKNNYLASLYISAEGCGLTYVDISTGELFCTEVTEQGRGREIIDEITGIGPTEIIYFVDEKSYHTDIIEFIGKGLDVYISEYDPWTFGKDYSTNQIKEQFNVMYIEGLGFSPDHFGIRSTGALLHYLKSTQKRTLAHINKINIYDLNGKMILDAPTRRNLELTETIREKNKKGSLLWILDKTLTAMGGRMIRRWIEEPLLDVEHINERLSAVEILKDDILLRKELKENLKQIYDLERLAGKIAFGSANPRDLVALGKSVSFLPVIRKLFTDRTVGLLEEILNNIDPLEDVGDLIKMSILEEPALTLKDGGIIKGGYNGELDELRKVSKEGKHWIARLEREEKDKTGIKFLKVGYNKIFGYYIEVSNSNLHLIPEHYIRKQTLVNCERYITPGLKEIESKILGAEEKIADIEYKLFIQIRDTLLSEIERIQRTANAVAKLDVLYSFAEVSEENNYVKPIVDDSEIIDIKEGRHPVVERVLGNRMFVPNDAYITEDERFLIITGPNMAGKSTYMRQVALIVLMAQIGSFVPAGGATVGITDRIFTRVGASDDLSRGQSTFMVEMNEMASIINLATEKSLLIIDEIGRGTSTFDGLSIAWSVVEYICKSLNSRTLFSTHYHELTKLSETHKKIRNYKVTVKEDRDDIIFLYRLLKGSADRSYGIQVARLAGLPRDIVDRANSILTDLEKKSTNEDYDLNGILRGSEVALTGNNIEQSGFTDSVYEEIIGDLRNIDLLRVTPIDALNILYKFQKKATEFKEATDE
jgi:DNA mismatch repair protein MutS